MTEDVKLTLVERLKAKAEDCEGEDRLDLRPDALVMREAITALEAAARALKPLNLGVDHMQHFLDLKPVTLNVTLGDIRSARSAYALIQGDDVTP